MKVDMVDMKKVYHWDHSESTSLAGRQKLGMH